MKNFKFIMLFTFLCIESFLLAEIKEIKPLGPTSPQKRSSTSTTQTKTRAGQSNFSEMVEDNIVIQGKGKKKAEIVEKPVETKTSETTSNTSVIPTEQAIDLGNTPVTPNVDASSISDNTAEETPKNIDNSPVVSSEDIDDAIPQRKELPPPSDREIDYDNRELRDGVVYVKGESQPFTGVVLDLPGTEMESRASYVNGIANGEQIWYSSKKVPLLVEVYKNGKLDGDSYEYYENGNVKTIKRYSSGKIMAVHSVNKNGKTIHKATFTDGNGLFKSFWENGNVLEVGEYKNWAKDGTWKRYQENGKIDVTSTYKNGVMTGQSFN